MLSRMKNFSYFKRPNFTWVFLTIIIIIIYRIKINVFNLYYHTLILQNVSLLSVEDGSFSPPPPNSIFFHETSSNVGLNSRQACSIESAARAHPGKHIYVMFSGPITNYTSQNSICLVKLQELHNIKFVRVHIAMYSKGTPLESLVLGALKKSLWPIEHSSDILKYLTLSKYGGVSLDTDVIVVKALDVLGKNWAARQDMTLINSAVLAISSDSFGRTIVNSIINDLSTSYDANSWGANGPGAITRNLKELCNTEDLVELNATTCPGFEVYGPELIYPIHYSNSEIYFKLGDPSVYMPFIKKAYTHHMWNHITYDWKIENVSLYAELAAKYCPTIYEPYGNNFGS